METSPLLVKAFARRSVVLYRATPAVTQDLGFSGLIQRNVIDLENKKKT
jgi:hypothetical protein